jgi:metal-sulfur cluster biosynthetic enzyme
MAALARVVDPCSIATGIAISLIDMGLIHRVEIVGAHVSITLRLTSPLCFQAGLIVSEVERQVARIPEVSRVECGVDPRAEWLPTMMAVGVQARLRRLRPSSKNVQHQHDTDQTFSA